ncbi:MAG: DTW domain-containing protein [Rhodospirillaceae bacterium]|nr:DTW domain-containing protein [Rhodospirillaceae bacterium]
MSDTPPPAESAAPAESPAECPCCRKPAILCVCDSVVPIENRLSLLILQHPQEQDKTLGTARLAALHFTDATLTVGLSWSSLAKALGRPADAQRWAVLYLGSANAAALAPDQEVVALDSKGNACGDQAKALAFIEGVIVLDGTWSQAKALWWRNPWVLKCKRVILGPKRPSRYGRVRTEPRTDSLSTIEAAGLLLSRLEDRPEIETELDATFQRMLEAFRAARSKLPKPPSSKRRFHTKGHRARLVTRKASAADACARRLRATAKYLFTHNSAGLRLDTHQAAIAQFARRHALGADDHQLFAADHAEGAALTITLQDDTFTRLDGLGDHALQD